MTGVNSLKKHTKNLVAKVCLGVETWLQECVNAEGRQFEHLGHCT
jgi:hypothetical protein